MACDNIKEKIKRAKDFQLTLHIIIADALTSIAASGLERCLVIPTWNTIPTSNIN